MSTIVEWSLFYAFSNVFKIHYLIAVIFAYSISTVFNYYFSTRWFFNVLNKSKQKFATFVTFSIIGLIINEFLMLLFIEILILNSMISKIIATIIVMIYNFVTRKIFIEDKY